MAEYIDRDVALDALDKSCDRLCPYPKKQRAIMCGSCAMGDAICIIEGLDAADVRENVKGEWIKSQRDEDFVVCSNCKNIGYRTAAWRTDYAERIKFCPNCGAEMRTTCDDQERLNNERLDRE